MPLKLRLISSLYLILPEVSSDAMVTAATYSSTMGIAKVMLQDQRGGLQLISRMARKMNSDERGDTFSA
jgi:hypothetical protein